MLQSSATLAEVIDRMVLGGAEIDSIFAVRPPRENLPRASASLLRIGNAHFPMAAQREPHLLDAMLDLVRALPLETGAFDFLIDEHGLYLWRIDDELGRVLPILSDPVGSRTIPEKMLFDALLALDSFESRARPGAIDLDGSEIMRALSI